MKNYLQILSIVFSSKHSLCGMLASDHGSLVEMAMRSDFRFKKLVKAAKLNKGTTFTYDTNYLTNTLFYFPVPLILTKGLIFYLNSYS